MNKNKVIIIGAGGHGKVVADIIKARGDLILGYLDDNTELKEFNNCIVLGTTEKIGKLDDCSYIIAIGANAIRKKIAQSYDVSWYSAIHPTAIISPSAKIGKGTVVMPGAIINASAEIGIHCIINTGAIIEHDSNISDYVHISPGAKLGGTVHVAEMTSIGIGACVRNNISICSSCVIGAGAVVVKDIEEHGIYVGVPARKR